MSDPVTNLEIEDVLSSIRRLVSEDARPRAKAPERPAGEKPDRLLLTPAQRVEVDEDEPLVDRAPSVESEQVADAQFFRSGDAAAPEPAPNEEDAGDSDEVSFIGRLVSEEMGRMLASEDAQPSTPPPSAAPVAEQTEEPSLADKIAALEALIAGHPELSARKATAAEALSDDGATDHPAATTEQRRASEALVLGGPPWRGSVSPKAQEDAPLALERAETRQGALALIEQEALREMVSDIVRQELQGALGERITRNVRKLVRREIHRVMVSQDLE